MIEIKEKLKSQQMTKRAKNLLSPSHAAILQTDAFILQLSARKGTLQVVLFLERGGGQFSKRLEFGGSILKMHKT